MIRFNVNYRRLFYISVIMLLTGCASNNYTLMKTQEPVIAEEKEVNVKYEYKIQPHDRVAITAYKYPDVIPIEMSNKGILVDSKGDILLPLVEKVHLAGLTQTQAALKLKRLYRKYLKKPSFNVEVLNKRIYILGEVNKKGALKLDKEQMTILEAIAMSGGLTNNAIRDKIIIVSRKPNGKMSMRSVNLTDFDLMKISNLMVRANDIIYVPPNGWKKIKVTADNLSGLIGLINGAVAPYLLVKNLAD